YTLQELWQQRSPNGTMTWEALRALGGVEGGLARRADAILNERYMPEQRDELRAILLRLVQPGEGVADTRRRVRLEDLALDNRPIEAVQALLAPLVDARLLVVMTKNERRVTSDESALSDRESRSSPVSDPSSVSVEIAHEALIRAWPALGAWVNAAREDLAF